MSTKKHKMEKPKTWDPKKILVNGNPQTVLAKKAKLSNAMIAKFKRNGKLALQRKLESEAEAAIPDTARRLQDPAGPQIRQKEPQP